MRSRSGLNIARMILETTKHGATKSRIMHDTYLSSEKTGVYLKILQENRLIRCEIGNNLYYTTERGFQILDEPTELSKLLHSLDSRFADLDSLNEFSDQLN